ncbi:MAG: hypothetical protein Q7S34_02440 [bacterium]|nr:hypothetical protein [bacterium]
MDHELSPSGHIPINDATLQQMSKEERAFWDDFLPRITAAIERAEERADTIPYEIPADLRPMVQTALHKYKGRKYCQMYQLAHLFNFGALVVVH